MGEATKSDRPASDLVSVERLGRVAVVRADNPPVNALGHALRARLAETLFQLESDSTVKGVVVACAGRTFFAGADATEFGKPPRSPSLRELIAQLEAMSKPTLAAMHGTVLGGGLELALVCDYRIAAEGTKLGLPEVKLGLIPGAGGTVRLTRLVGPLDALRLIVTGEPIGAKEALAKGLIDAIASRPLVEEAMAYLDGTIERGKSRRSTGEGKLNSANRAEVEAAAKDLLAKSGKLEAPAAAARSVVNVLTMPFDAALAEERRLFVSLVEGTQSKALRHLFFAERAAARLDEPVASVPELTQVGIIGSGTMGGGIAMAFANAGLSVTVVDISAEALTRGRGVVEKNYAASQKRGSLTAAEVSDRQGRIGWTTEYPALAGCQLVIEAALEEIGIKRDVVARLDAVCTPTAVFVTNTSYLDVDEIAAGSKDPGRVLGMHFFSPANVMKLVEIAKGHKTTRESVALVQAAAKKIGKLPVFVGLCRGFVGNRMLAARNGDVMDLLLEGATPSAVDALFLE
jgi:3-hydroxyacyl-CoA dehydrogenase